MCDFNEFKKVHTHPPTSDVEQQLYYAPDASNSGYKHNLP